MAELIGHILDVIKFISRNASKYLKFQRKFTEYVDDFNQAQADLRAKEADFQQQLEDEHHFGKMPKQEVKRWFEKVEQKLGHAQHVEDKISKGKYLFRSCLGKLVDEATQAMKEVVNDPSTIEVNLPTPEVVVATNVREEIYQYLMGDAVGLVVFDIRKLQKDIASQLERNLSDDENITVRAGKLSEMLRGEMRYVLILDDEAMNLFLSKAGQDMLPNPTLESLMELAVRECGGLPLAVVTLAGCMRGKSDPCMWEDAIEELRGNIRNINDMEDKVYGCLKFSYDRLQRIDQDCLLYCALYPEDDVIDKDEIIEKWMEEGLIDGMGSRKAMEGSGHSILQKLEENCLLERVQDRSCIKMHDLVRDMALHITRKRFLVKAGMQLEEVPNMEEWGEDLEKFGETVLLLRGCWNLRSLPCLSKLQALKKLDLGGSGIEKIPQGLEMLVNLRYLNLKRTIRLTGIPTGTLSKLCRLQYWAVHFKLESAEELRELNKLEVFEDWFHNVCGLNTFARIKTDVGDEIILPYGIKELSVLECRGVRSINDIGLRDATDLKKCELRGCTSKLESLDLIELENLKVIVEVGAGESSVDRFSSLKEITLWNCDKIKKLFSADWVLSNLEVMDVRYCSELEEIITESEKKRLGKLVQLQRICSENGVMGCDSLQSITISYCPKLKRIPLYLPQLEIDDEGKLSPSNSLQRIQVYPIDWWEAVEWEHPNFNIKNVVRPLKEIW
ncbi:hypothetical protein GOBAR_AA15023 [Gossypium barbadense]|uniref:Uncharacterized protein n=1 Tax=Gossypium barbadense TaxID=3634 RepID=A0A2P5XQR1_GOSBA|nr:hypothetical protein GOBAR_AA15023 [Gossypium barbadense]